MTPIIRRLRELADGAEPASERVGICYDLEQQSPFEMKIRFHMYKIFHNMGLDTTYPVGKHSFPWVGEYGRMRRRLAAATADFLETGVIDASFVEECNEFRRRS